MLHCNIKEVNCNNLVFDHHSALFSIAGELNTRPIISVNNIGRF